MAGPSPRKYEDVSAAPVKSFFVSMLTRDITLADAILDLLDNCVDGILRTGKRGRRAGKPYDGYRAEIEFGTDSFSISDNCGGIPWDLHKYAFKMGPDPDRPSGPPGSVGVYGIGMKRAIFKMGTRCVISTQSGRDRYDVQIPPGWMEDEALWTMTVSAPRGRMPEDGTTIVVGGLRPGIREDFSVGAEAFKSALHKAVATQYAFIIDKGLRVTINGDAVDPRPTKLIFAEGNARAEVIRPFVFRTKVRGVDVFLAVGFTRPIPSTDEVESEQEDPQYSSLDAGWTVLCNDRAVVYCDRTELTGWGEAGVPRYHTQFIAVSGIVEFRSRDASKLPTTTTKRGIDASSPLYLQVKNKMREGMQIFTDYTNRWKSRAAESKIHISAGSPLGLEQIRALPLSFAPTTGPVPGEQFKPRLPRPEGPPRRKRISFTKDGADVETVAEYLFEDPSTAPSLVGEQCFDLFLEEATK